MTPMTPKEHLIARLVALCNLRGVTQVADAADVSADNLKQILAGTLLPSGAPRGVGPKIQRKLDAAFPGWSGLPGTAPPPAAPPPDFRDPRNPTESGWSILQDLEVLPTGEREAFVNEVRERASVYRVYLHEALERMKHQPTATPAEGAPAPGKRRRD